MSAHYRCGTSQRREAVRTTVDNGGVPILNGIDFVEVAADKQTIAVHFIHPLPGEVDGVPAAPPLTGENIRIDGGVRITGIELDGDPVAGGRVLTVLADQTGDYSRYTLRLIRAVNQSMPPVGFDPQLSSVDFVFDPNCPDDFDCVQSDPCPPTIYEEPEIDYLARDYQGFRRLMLDHLSTILPEWAERNPADMGVALVELLAYVADYLSYQQDAVGTEAYLHTARRRVSVARHARLVDYVMHNGSNARAWVHVRVHQNAAPFVLPMRTPLFTRVSGLPPRVPANQLPSAAELNNDPVIFETMRESVELRPEHNILTFYTWGDEDCCLLRGATRATLEGNFPNLAPGHVLIFQERVGAKTGEPQDADRSRRHAVRLVSVQTESEPGVPLTDPLYDTEITEIIWHAEDALPFPFTLSSRDNDGTLLNDVSVALGNIVLADHGMTLPEYELLPPVPVPTLRRVIEHSGRLTVKGLVESVSTAVGDPTSERTTVPPRYRPVLLQPGLTFAADDPYINETSDAIQSAAAAFRYTPSEARAEVLQLRSGTACPDVYSDVDYPDVWSLADTLFSSDANDRVFVIEVENNGAANLRFGDGAGGFGNGLRPTGGTCFAALYRVGGGVSGNIPAGALVHMLTDLPVELVTNPLPAMGGTARESIESARQSAPYAFRENQERAVTLEDYSEILRRHNDVQRAAATMRWTGSWHTVFMTIDRFAGAPVTPAFERRIRDFIERYRMAGQDVEVDAPRFVPLRLEIEVCVMADYFRSAVQDSLLRLFTSRHQPNGDPGLFHPDRFTFGQTIYLSPFIEAAESVPGVDSVTITVFERYVGGTPDALTNGMLELSRLEIAQLDNDPNFPDRGVFKLTLQGGK